MSWSTKELPEGLLSPFIQILDENLMMVVVNQSGVIQYASDRYCHYFHKNQDQLKGQIHQDFDKVKSVEIIDDSTKQAVSAAGETLRLSCTWFSFQDQLTQEQHYLFMYSDVTEKEQLKEQLQANIQRYSKNVHKLGNLLAVARCRAEILDKRVSDNEKLQKDTLAVLTQIDKITQQLHSEAGSLRGNARA